jgi:hypothetical protein
MYLPPNVKQVPGIKSASSEGFTFQDDSRVKADALIYCTGRLTNSEMKERRCISTNSMGTPPLASVYRFHGNLRFRKTLEDPSVSGIVKKKHVEGLLCTMNPLLLLLLLLLLHRLRVFENGVLRRIFGPKRDE